MKTLHTFGCSITQGFALPDVVAPILNDKDYQCTDDEIEANPDIDWADIHLYKPSKYAWPQVLGEMLDMNVVNHARRGACFQQISRQCAVGAKDIQPDDTVIVMWTYLSRLSLQWPARTSVPFCNIVASDYGWQTVITGFNKLFGLEKSKESTNEDEEKFQKYIENSTKNTYLDPMGVYNRYYNNLVLQQMTDGFLRATGAKIIHLSVETQRLKDQLEGARNDLHPTLKDPYNIPSPDDWYNIDVDHDSCFVILDPNIPPAENDMHPSIQHHSNFANHIYKRYF